MSADGAVFENIIFDRCTFDNSMLRRAKFDFCTFKHTSFKKANLSHCEYKDSVLDHVDFSGSTLNYASFDTCEIYYLIIKGTGLFKTIFYDTQIMGLDVNYDLPEALIEGDTRTIYPQQESQSDYEEYSDGDY